MRKILVVDDDLDFLRAMVAFLTSNNYAVTTTPSLVEGFALLPSFQPDLVFVASIVGYQDGRQLSRKIKWSDSFRHIKVILISDNQEGLKYFQDCGADAAMKKPFPSALLLELLERLL